MRKSLRKYQRKALEYSSKVEHPAFFIDTRLGKTLTAIRDIKRFRKQNPNIKKILVICPISAFLGWEKDLSSEGEKYSIIFHEVFSKRRKKLIDEGWNIINPGGVRAFRKCMGGLNDSDIVIIDESTSVKNPRAEISKLCTKFFRSAERRIILTATPDAKSDIDFVNQCIFLDHNILGSNYYEFKKKYTVPTGDGKTVIARKYRDWFFHRLSSFCFFLKRKEVKLENEVIQITRLCKMEPKLQKIYKRLEDEFVIQTSDNEEEYISLFHAISKYISCRMIASGIVEDTFYKHKTNELINLINELGDEQLVVWVNYKKEFSIIQEALSKEKFTYEFMNGDTPKPERLKRAERFNSGKTRILFINPEIYKFGTDLSVANIQCYFSIPMAPETYLQSMDRTYKVGKTEALYIYYLITDDTVDLDMYEAVIRNLNRTEFNRFLINELKKRRKNGN
jgi:SNF2 family DNA or RNA helicase